MPKPLLNLKHKDVAFRVVVERETFVRHGDNRVYRVVVIESMGERGAIGREIPVSFSILGNAKGIARLVWAAILYEHGLKPEPTTIRIT